MKTFLKAFTCLLVVAALGACSSVTFREKGGSRLAADPTYQESKPYYLFGLIGEHHVDVVAACGKRQVKQFQAQTTLEDALLGLVTLGIYFPRSARIWCE